MECDNLCRHPPRYINVLVRCIKNASPVSMHSKSQTSPSVMLSTSSRWKVNNVGWQQFLRAHRTNKHYMIDKLLYLVLHTSSLWKLVTLLEEHTCQITDHYKPVSQMNSIPGSRTDWPIALCFLMRDFLLGFSFLRLLACHVLLI